MGTVLLLSRQESPVFKFLRDSRSLNLCREALGDQTGQRAARPLGVAAGGFDQVWSHADHHAIGLR